VPWGSTLIVDPSHYELARRVVISYLRLAPAHPDFEDAVQEGAMRMWAGEAAYDPARGDWEPYAVMVCKSRLTQWERVRRRRGFTRVGDRAWEKASVDRPASLPAPNTLPDRESPPDARIEIAELVARTWGTIDGFSRTRREVFLRRFSEGLSLRTIGKAVGLKKDEVVSHLRAGLRILRAELGAEAGSPTDPPSAPTRGTSLGSGVVGRRRR
jgi:RNA polymerase sigma factor (sigma-70 family)